MTIFIKSNIRRSGNVINKMHSDIVLLRLNIDIFKNVEQDLYVYGISISPHSSSYMKRNDVDKSIFDKLESNRIGKIMILGDLK